MNVKLHIVLDQFFNIFRLVAPIVTCGGWFLVELWRSVSESRIPLVMAGLGLLAAMLLWYFLPIPCERLGCTGRMKLTTERVSFWRVSSLYECDNCGAVHRAEIFNPNFEITADYG